MPDDVNENKPVEKPFLDHLEDLRITIFKIIVVVFLGMILGLVFSKKIFVILRRPLESLAEEFSLNPAEVGLNVLGPQKGFIIIMLTVLVTGLIISIPFSLYFIAQFISPGLSRKEKVIVAPAFCASVFLFLGGVAFCYFITLPMVLKLLWKFNTMFGFHNMWTVNAYLSMVTKFMIANGLVFEMPLVLLVLVKLGILSPETLKTKRKYAVFIISIISALLSPPDLPSMFLVAAPMLVLYEISVWIAVLMKKRKPQDDI